VTTHAYQRARERLNILSIKDLKTHLTQCFPVGPSLQGYINRTCPKHSKENGSNVFLTDKKKNIFVCIKDHDRYHLITCLQYINEE
jgi:hypothetical protein